MGKPKQQRPPKGATRDASHGSDERHNDAAAATLAALADALGVTFAWAQEWIDQRPGDDIWDTNGGSYQRGEGGYRVARGKVMPPPLRDS